MAGEDGDSTEPVKIWAFVANGEGGLSHSTNQYRNQGGTGGRAWVIFSNQSSTNVFGWFDLITLRSKLKLLLTLPKY